jgi:hypothetical protein
MNILIRYGLSSLLFIISAIKSIQVSKSQYWITANHLLIGSSFMHHAQKIQTKLYLQIDYLIILLINLAYMNNFYMTIIGIGFAIYEYSIKQNIEFTKNFFTIGGFIYGLYNNYNLYFYTLCLNINLCICMYAYKYYLYLFNVEKFNNIRIYMNWLWHALTVNLLYTLCETI